MKNGIISSLLLCLVSFAAQAETKFNLPYAQNHAAVLEQAQKLGAPMIAVERALKEAERSTFEKKDVVTVFDLSQTSKDKRFYMLDLKAGKTTAYHASHGKGNGDHLRASRFKGFNVNGSSMTPLGALKALNTSFLDHYTEVSDSATGKTYTNLVIVDLVGTRPYNDNINRENIWVVGHSKWYVTEGFRKENGGTLGRSLGCVVIDPVYSNQVFYRIAGGSLMYVTVGNDPIEKYLQKIISAK